MLDQQEKRDQSNPSKEVYLEPWEDQYQKGSAKTYQKDINPEFYQSIISPAHR
jgi:hypothetical protein